MILLTQTKYRVGIAVLLCVFGAATLFALPGCDSPLTETPESFVSEANFFQNADQARSALNGVYKSLHRNMGQQQLTVFEQPPYMVNTQDDSGSPEGAANLWTWGPGHRGITAIWPHMYEGINDANTFIANIQDVPGMADETKAQFAAEARFIRAWHHFELLTVFGNIPYKTQPTSSIINEVPQSSATAVYDSLITELQAIQGSLPEITEYSGGDKARINKSAAKVLLAKVYLQRASGHPPSVSPGSNDYSNAESLLREVIQTGNYSLTPTYGELFDVDGNNERNSETIFSVEHMRAGGQGTTVENFLNPRGSNWGIGQWTTHYSNLDFYLSYQSSDVRKEVSWLDEYTDPSGQVRTFDPFDVENDGFEESGASLNKLIYQDPTLGWADGPRDWIYFRYADVKLMLAEAINGQGGPTGEAYDMVDDVRDRANVPPITRGLTQGEFSDSLYQERMWEFTQEFHGWRDCQRFFDRCKFLVEKSAENADPQDERRPVEEITIETPKHRLWPIPSQAMERNPALEQNPGYPAN